MTPLGPIWGYVRTVAQDTGGASAIEYSLIASLIAIGIAGGIGALADLVAMLWNLMITAVTDASASFP